jgi:membrane protein YqaA with SNARE-associated domain
VLLLAIMDGAGIPIVGGVDLLVVTIAALDHSSAYWAAGAATLGSLLGSFVLFSIARKGGETYLSRFTSHGRGAKLKGWFLEYGLLTVFVPALAIVPLPMKVAVLSAGALGVGPVAFLLVLLVARIPRYVFLAWLGTRLGNDTLPYLKHHTRELIIFAILLFSVLYLLIRLLDRRHKLAHLTESE